MGKLFRGEEIPQSRGSPLICFVIIVVVVTVIVVATVIVVLVIVVVLSLSLLFNICNDSYLC